MAEQGARRPPPVVSLPRSVAEAILAHAEGSPDEEVCGLLGGVSGTVRNAYPGHNVAAERRQHFDMEPRSQLAAMRAMAARGEDLVGIYHSHVEAPAYPSPTDLALHAYPDALYVIAAPRAVAAKRLRAFLIDGDQVTEVSLALGDT